MAAEKNFLLKQFAESSSARKAQFGSLEAGNPVITSDPAAIQALQAYKDGWEAAVSAGEDKLPPLEDRQGLDYLFCASLIANNREGINNWLPDEKYHTGCFTKVNSKLYYSLTDDNIGNNPAEDKDKQFWKEFQSGGGGLIGQIVAYQCAEGYVPFGHLPTTGGIYNASDFQDFWDNYLMVLSDIASIVRVPQFTSNTQGGFTVNDSRSSSTAYQYLNGAKTLDVGKWNTFSLTVESGENKNLSSYSITASTNGSVDYPSAWQVQGYDEEGSKWDVIDQVGSQSFSAGQRRLYVVANHKQYKKFMINFLSGVESQGSGSIGRIQFNFTKPSSVLAPITFDEFDSMVASTGSCGMFAVDIAQQKFKAPLISDGTFIEAGDGSSKVAGLPNITADSRLANSTATGVVNSGAWDDFDKIYAPDGNAFEVKQDTTLSSGYSGVGQIKRSYLTFNASKSNPFYGKSNTVQPKSISTRYFVKVANAEINESSFNWAKYLNALENKANIDFSNLTLSAKAKLDNYVQWAINDGTKDAQGENAIMEGVGTVAITFNTLTPMVATVANGNTYEVTNIAPKMVDEDGTFNVFLNPITKDVQIFKNKIDIQNAPPEAPATNDTWLDTSSNQLHFKYWNNSQWVDIDYLFIGTVTVLSGNITIIKNRGFNINGADQEKIREVMFPYYKKIIKMGTSTNPVTLSNNAYLHLQAGNSQSAAAVIVQITATFPNGKSIYFAQTASERFADAQYTPTLPKGTKLTVDYMMGNASHWEIYEVGE